MNDVFYAPVTTIDGIGHVTSSALRKKNILYVADLLADYISRLAGGQKLPENEANFFEVCLLLLVEGMDKDSADALNLEGVSVRRLDDLRAETVQEKIQKQQDLGRVPRVPSLDEIRWWGARASRIASCPIIALRLSDLSEASQNHSFTLNVSGSQVQTTSTGTAILAGTPPWEQVVKVYRDDHFLDFIDLRGANRQYETVYRGYSSVAPSNDMQLSMREGRFTIPSGGRIEFNRVSPGNLEAGSTFVARGDPDSAYLVGERYEISQRTAVLSIVEPDTFMSVPGHRYTWDGAQFNPLEVSNGTE